MAVTPRQPSLRHQLAANTRWSREDPAVNAARGQAGLRDRFEREAREADPEASEAEITRRGQSAYKAHFQRLAYNREKARAARKAAS